ncbi:autotransporter domain-containing protein [Bradyrhizobium sp. SYSU BS000235]|uniref:autotransporter domain-containing protein n=1 Tax=Bradyrhizobium sp. SYSU BS000235 TaxID=3411332 RepID=UPI003C7176D2
MTTNRFKSTRRLRVALLTSTALVLASMLASTSAQAQVVLNVTDGASLSAAITQADSNASTSYVINFQNNITLTAAAADTLAAFNTTSNVTVNGNGFKLDGGGVQRGFFVYSGTVAINDLAIVNANATGGNGGGALTGAGGGMGAGGALFVAAGGNVTVSNVSLNSNSAAGGAGGFGSGSGFTSGAGGGGMGGNGGGLGGFGNTSGGGGGLGLGADGGATPGQSGAAGIVTGTAGGGASSDGGTGGANGGGGGASAGALSGAAGGGGIGGAVANGYTAGNGGFGGGGGATYGSFLNPSAPGNGGFGGGGGSSGAFGGGAGGFGGGSGGQAAGGFGGGSSSQTSSQGGGGGAGMGGAIFVQDGGTFKIAGSFNVDGNSVSGGAGGSDIFAVLSGGSPAPDGSAFGSGLFLQGAGTLAIQPGSGQTQTISDVIADQVGVVANGYVPSSPLAGTEIWGLNVSGGGTLVLAGANLYSGGTTVSSTTVVVTNNSSVGTGAVTLDGGVFKAGADGLAFGNSFLLTATAGNTIDTNGNTLTLSGVISDAGGSPGALTKAGTGTLILSGVNTYSGGTTINAGTLQIAGAGTLGSISAATTVAGGTLDLGGTTQTQNGGVTLTSGSITHGVLASSGLFDVRAGSIDAILAGSGALEKNGTGTVTLSGDNAYTGGTTINDGTLQLASAGTLGANSSTTTVAGGTLDLGGTAQTQNGGVTLTSGSITNGTLSSSGLFDVRAGSIDAILAGSGALEKNGTGTVTLSGANTYTGGTTINAGTLQLGNSTGVGSILGAITVGSGTTFDVVNADTSGITSITNNGTTYFHNSSTAGAATINNQNTIEFLDSSTAGNATITMGGFFSTGLTFRDSSSAGSATITNSNGSAVFANTSSAGSARITNFDSFYFADAATAGHATITNFSNIFFNSTSTAGSAVITNNSSLSFSGSATAGSATITNNGSGSSLAFSDTSTAGSASIVNNGYVVFDANSTAGSATIANNTGARVGFYGSSTGGNATITNNAGVTLGFFETSTGGNATILNNAGGTVDFSHSTGLAGDGKLSVGSIAGAGDVYLGARELTVGGNNLNTTVSGVIGDCGAGATACNAYAYGFNRTGGSLVKTGTGTLTLSGVNTYTGATTVNGGTLAVNGDLTLSSGITVNDGGALGGSGTVGSTAIMSGGTLAPGNSIGTLTVNGSLVFSTGSFYKVEASPTSADRTNVLGIATLTGATVQAVALPGSFRAQTYTILNATGGFGGTQFAGITGDTFAPGARNPHLTYDANNVFLVLDPGTIALPAGTGGNQTNVAGAINKAVESGFTPPAGFDALLNMSGAKLANALNQVSGQPGATTTQGSFSAMQQFVTMINPFSGSAGSGQGGVMSFASEALGYAAANSPDAKMRAAYAAVMPPTAPASLNERWGVWASAYGGSSTISGNSASGSSSTTSRIYGSVAGADYRFSPDTIVGFALGGAGFNFAVSDGLGSGRADLFQAGIYGRHAMGAAYISGTFAYGLQDVTTDRTVTVSGSDKLQANFKANTFTGRVESGYRFAPWPAFGATPYAAVQVSSFDLPGYRERATSGSDQFALAYNAQTTMNVRTELGTRADKLFLRENGLFTLSGRLAWAHDSNTDRPVTATFQSLPGASFTVNGAKPAADSALVTAGAEMKWLNGFSLGGSFEGEFSNTTQTYAGKTTLRYGW